MHLYLDCSRCSRLWDHENQNAISIVITFDSKNRHVLNTNKLDFGVAGRDISRKIIHHYSHFCTSKHVLLHWNEFHSSGCKRIDNLNHKAYVFVPATGWFATRCNIGYKWTRNAWLQLQQHLPTTAVSIVIKCCKRMFLFITIQITQNMYDPLLLTSVIEMSIRDCWIESTDVLT